MTGPPAAVVRSNDFVGQWQAIRDAALGAVDRVGRSGWLVLGREVEAFERELAHYCGVRHVVGCGSGLDAIEIALRAAGVRPGARVLTTPLSAFATTLAIIRAGGTPVFVDVDESGLLDLDLAEPALASDSAIRCLLPVHLFGHAHDLDRLESFASRYDVTVVEDCAQAIGARSRGRAVGSAGAASATSFYPTKNLGCLGDGGALLTDDDAVAEQARRLRDYGQAGKYEHVALGLNSRLDELQAAVLRDALLPRLEAATTRRRAIAESYLDGLSHPALRVPPIPSGSESVWHLFPILVDGDREAFRRHLADAGVETGVHYPFTIPSQPALRAMTDASPGTLIRAERFASSEVSLPIHPLLAAADIERVIAACNSWSP